MTTNEGAHYLDIGAVTVWIASLAQILPSVAALLSIIWFAIRILESATVQQMLGPYAWIKKDTERGTDQD
jgi:hypothetical protein